MYFTHNNKKHTLVWFLLLSLTLLCVQGAKLHVHYLDCKHEQPGGLTTTGEAHGYAQHGKIHLVTNGSHGDHAEAGMSELDVKPQGLLKKLPSVISLLVAIVSLFILLLPAFTRHIFQQFSGSSFISLWRYVLSPPLRAPPPL